MFDLKKSRAENVSRTLFSIAAFSLLLTVALIVSGAAQKLTLTEPPFSILAPLVGDFTNFQNASNVLGQTNFTSGGTGTTAAKFNLPDQAIVDPVSGKIFVSDETNNRVLRFASSAAMTNGAAAEAVFGQPDFTTITPGTAANKFRQQTGIAIDAVGRLWVSDFANNRVLRFDGAATKATGASADGVLGQTDFITGTSGAGANKMFRPIGIFADADGRLWVAERVNNRVLRFDNAAVKADGANADTVLGQPDFTTVTAGAGASKMDNPHGITLDTDGRLYVADRDNNRVLRFDAAATKANGSAADAVLGQPDFATVTTGTTASKMNFVLGVTTDANNRLYVADGNNNRVIIFNNAGTLASGAAASRVLGQPNFTTATANNGGITASSLRTPYLLSFDEASSSLFVGDYGNNRILRFTPAVATAANVSVSGRVLTDDGSGLRNAVVYLTKANGETVSTRTSSFGYYRFDDLEAGQTLIISVFHKRYQFTPQVVTINEVVDNLDFTPQNDSTSR